VIVAVIRVRVMEVAVDDVVGVVTVRDGVVTARRAVDVVLLVARAGAVLRSAAGGVLSVDRERVLVDVVAVCMMEMTVVQEVLVPVVLDLLVAAVSAVLMVVSFVRLVIRHGRSPARRPSRWSLASLVVVLVLVDVAFGGMLDGALDQIADVGVSKRIEDVLPGATSGDDALGA
jgi:hypothetical protein